MRNFLSTIAGILLAVGAAQAAKIAWETPVNVSGNGSTDVSQNGVLLYGVSFYTPRGNSPDKGYVGGTSTTVNGVLFDLPTANNNVAVSFRSQTMDNEIREPVPTAISNGTDYEKLFLSNAWEATGVDGTITLRHLTPGKEYEIQVFVGDARYSSEKTSIDGINLNVAQGQHLIGTFIADAETQAITLDGSGVVTALQVRQITNQRPLGFIFAVDKRSSFNRPLTWI